MQEEGGSKPRLGQAQPADPLSSALGWVQHHPLWALGLAVPLLAALPLVSWAAGIVFAEFLPALVVSGMLAVAATLASFVFGKGALPLPLPAPESEMNLLGEETQAEAAAAGVAGAKGRSLATPETKSVDDARAPIEKEDLAPHTPATHFLRPSEPSSAANLEGQGQGQGSGLLQGAADTISGAFEEALEAVEPGREQAGEVIQETESGGEEVTATPGSVRRAVRKVASAVQGASRKALGVAGKAKEGLSKQVPGSEISGQGAEPKGMAQEYASQAAAAHGPPSPLNPSHPHSAPKPSVGAGTATTPSSASPAGAAATEGVGSAEGGGHAGGAAGAAEALDPGYSSDSDRPGPVLEGVHPHAQQHRGQADAQAAGTGQAPGGEGPEEHPWAELAAEAAESAGQKLKHAAALVTGTAEEQRPPSERLEEAGQSLAEMEKERQEGVEEQAAVL